MRGKKLKKGRAILANAAALWLLSFALAASAPRERVLDDYKNGLAPGWEVKFFAGRTSYTAEQSDGRPSIKAVSKATASGLVYKISYDPIELPVLRWSWKIEKTIAGGDERSKAGDDYAARVYVLFPSLAFWNTKALNYIWANRLAKGEALPNAYTANAVMIAVESGDALAGRWLNEERDIVADFRKHFKFDPPKVGAIAIMTDTDNTGESAVAWYGPISIGMQRTNPKTAD